MPPTIPPTHPDKRTTVSARRRPNTAGGWRLLPLVLLLVLPVTVQAQYSYTVVNNATVTIDAYTGFGGPVTIPGLFDGKPVTVIGSGAFSNTNVSRVTVPSGVVSIGASAFAGCNDLVVAFLPSTLGSIGDSAFQNCGSLVAAALPAALNSLGGGAFAGCSSLYSAAIGNNVASIRDGTFAGCSSLTTLTLGSSVTSIGSSAFSGCASLVGVAIGKDVTSIGDGAFEDCNILAGITVDAANAVYSSVEGVLFNIDQTTLLRFPGGKGGSYIIPDTVTDLSVRAFKRCKGLTGITIPNSVLLMGNGAFQECDNLASVIIGTGVSQIPDHAFSGCTRLAGVYCPGSAPSLGTDAFSGVTGGTVYYPPGNGWVEGGLFGGLPTEMFPFTFGSAGGGMTITQYIGPGGAVVLPSSIAGLPVTGIGKKAFLENGTVTNVVLPGTVSSIGSEAFRSCTGLAGIYFNGPPPVVGANAFTGVTGATVYYPPGHGWSGSAVFEGLPTVMLPYDYTASAGGIVLNGYTGPGEMVIIPGTIAGLPVVTIGSSAFAGSDLTSVTIPDSVLFIEDGAFSSCTSLTSLYFEGDAPGLGVDVFLGSGDAVIYYLPAASGWTATYGDRPAAVLPFDYTIFENEIVITGYTGASATVTIPATIAGLPVVTISNYAFSYKTLLTSIAIPSGVTSIGDNAFIVCSAMASVTVDGANTAYRSVDGVLFNKDQTTLVLFPGGKAGIYAIPAGVTSIGNSAFHSCSGLAGITIPDGVASIGNSAFFGCSGLITITIPDGVGSIGDSVFYDCAGLASAGIPGSVTAIGDNSFLGCTSLAEVTIPDGVTRIGVAAFDGCASLTSLSIPGNVTVIGLAAFTGCTSLTSITVDAANVDFRSADGVLFNNNQTTLIACPGGKTGSYSIPSSVNTIGPQAFAVSALTSITIPGSVTTIGERAFYNCRNLTSITIPDSVTTIEYQTFAACPDLWSVTIPGSVTSIGVQAFFTCPSLRFIHFLGDAPTLGDAAFLGSLEDTAVYYQPGSAGWSDTYGGLPTAIWVPLKLLSPGVLEGFFGFTIIGPAYLSVVVEISDNLVDWKKGPNPNLQLDEGGRAEWADPVSISYHDPENPSDKAQFYRVSLSTADTADDP